MTKDLKLIKDPVPLLGYGGFCAHNKRCPLCSSNAGVVTAWKNPDPRKFEKRYQAWDDFSPVPIDENTNIQKETLIAQFQCNHCFARGTVTKDFAKKPVFPSPGDVEKELAKELIRLFKEDYFSLKKKIDRLYLSSDPENDN